MIRTGLIGGMAILAGMVALRQSGEPGVIAQLPGIAIDDYVAARPGGAHIYFPDAERGLMMYDRRTGQTHELLNALVWELAVSSAGDRIAFARQSEDTRDYHVWTMPVNPRTGLPTGPARRITSLQGDVPSFSPDGRWVAFMTMDPRALAVVPADGGPERVLTSIDHNIEPIRWSADGRFIYYGAWRAMHGEEGTFRVAVDGGRPVRLPIENAGESYPGLNPSGRRILVFRRDGRALVSDTAGRLVYTMPAASSSWYPAVWSSDSTVLGHRGERPRTVNLIVPGQASARVLTDSTEEYTTASWSPDGARLVAQRSGRSAQGAALAAFTAAGTREVVFAAHHVGGIWWSPDGNRVAYVIGDAGRVTPPRLAFFDFTAKRETTVAEAPVHNARWTEDSRRLVYLTNAPATGDSTAITVNRWNGASTERLGGIRTDCVCSGAITDSTVLVWTQSGSRAMILDLAGNHTKTVLSSSNMLIRNIRMSPDRNTLAIFRGSTSSAVPTQIELVTADGLSRHVVAAPIPLDPRNLGQVLMGGRTMLLYSQQAGDSVGVHHFDVATMRLRRIAIVPGGGTVSGGIAASPDGARLAFTAPGRAWSELVELQVPREAPGRR